MYPRPHVHGALLAACADAANAAGEVSREAFDELLEARAAALLRLSAGQRPHLVLAEPSTCRAASWISIWIMGIIFFGMGIIVESCPEAQVGGDSDGESRGALGDDFFSCALSLIHI